MNDNTNINHLLEGTVSNRRGPSQSVAITATARLHMGFFDLHSGLGRRFGSIGMSLDRPVTQLQAWRADSFTAEGNDASRAISIAKAIALALDLDGGVHLQLEHSIPQHAGLGAGTQLSLAVGMALKHLYNLELQLTDIARLTKRGARSGIGLGTFATGGVIVDGGRGPQTIVPPVIARAEFPEDWRVILTLDHEFKGLHGDAEMEAFSGMPQFSADTAAILCRHVLMQALPALAEHDLAAFGAAIRELQERIGDYFSPMQGGRYASPRVSKILHWLHAHGVSCYGQSSWGPTGFAICENESQATELLQHLQGEFSSLGAIEFMVCRGRNQGAVISTNSI